MEQPTENTTPDLVLVKAPGGGSVSHAGVEYLPDADGNILLPRAIKNLIEGPMYHNDSSGRFNAPSRVMLEEIGQKPPGST